METLDEIIKFNALSGILRWVVTDCAMSNLAVRRLSFSLTFTIPLKYYHLKVVIMINNHVVIYSDCFSILGKQHRAHYIYCPYMHYFSHILSKPLLCIRRAPQRKFIVTIKILSWMTPLLSLTFRCFSHDYYMWTGVRLFKDFLNKVFQAILVQSLTY